MCLSQTDPRSFQTTFCPRLLYLIPERQQKENKTVNTKTTNQTAEVCLLHLQCGFRSFLKHATENAFVLKTEKERINILFRSGLCEIC